MLYTMGTDHNQKVEETLLAEAVVTVYFGQTETQQYRIIEHQLRSDPKVHLGQPFKVKHGLD